MCFSFGSTFSEVSLLVCSGTCAPQGQFPLCLVKAPRNSILARCRIQLCQPCSHDAEAHGMSSSDWHALADHVLPWHDWLYSIARYYIHDIP